VFALAYQEAPIQLVIDLLFYNRDWAKTMEKRKYFLNNCKNLKKRVEWD
jgi:hypothetical protein